MTDWSAVMFTLSMSDIGPDKIVHKSIKQIVKVQAFFFRFLGAAVKSSSNI